MFVALQLLQRENDGIFDRLRGILSRPKVTVQSGTMLDAPYTLLSAEAGRNGPDWGKIEELARDSYARCILLPVNVTPPEGFGLPAFVPDSFNQQVLLRTACAMIQGTRMPMYRRMLGLIDEDGRFTDMLPELLKYFTAVKVLTRNLATYTQAGEEMMHQLGAPVLFANTLSGLNDCVLVLSPGAYRSEENTRLACPVLSAGPLKLRIRPEEFHGLLAAPPKGAEKVPEGVSPHHLLAALYELDGLRGFDLVARSLLYNHKITTLQEAVRTTAMMAGFSCPDPF